MSEGIKEVSMTPEQKERNLQMFARHIHFWWPRTSDKEIQGAFERLGSRAAFRAERSRKRRWAIEAGGEPAGEVNEEPQPQVVEHIHHYIKDGLVGEVKYLRDKIAEFQKYRRPRGEY